MIVRRTTFEDLEKLAILFDEYRQFHGASSHLKTSLSFLEQRFKNQQSVIFMHLKDDVITGFILLYLGFSSVTCSTYYILDDVYVTPHFRRQGSARQLIDTVILFARNESISHLSLNTQQHNLKSHKLYESMGFIKENEFQTYQYFLT